MQAKEFLTKRENVGA